jgi:hypothetical protein
LELDIGNYH